MESQEWCWSIAGSVLIWRDLTELTLAIFKADLAAVGLAKAVVRFNDDLIDLDNMVMNYQSGIKKSLVLIGKIHLFNNNKRKNLMEFQCFFCCVVFWLGLTVWVFERNYYFKEIMLTLNALVPRNRSN